MCKQVIFIRTRLESQPMCLQPRHCIATSLLLAYAAFAPALHAAPATYALDPVHTRVAFAVEHAGFSQAIGTVSGSTGQLRFDPDDWRSAQLQVSVPLERVDLGDEKWNASVLAGNLLDVARFPSASFVSTRIEPINARRATVFGNLSLRGVTREVALEVNFNVLKRHPLPPFRRTAGFSATTVISRADFGISAWKSMIGDRVELRMEVEAILDRGDEMIEPADAVPAADAAEPPAAPEPTPP